MLRSDLRSMLGPDERLLDEVFQLANIARPRIPSQKLQCLFAEFDTGASFLLQPFLEEMFGQERNILAAFTEWRENERNDVDAIVEVFSELRFSNKVIKILVRRCHDADIDLDWLNPPDSCKFALLDDTQELRLRDRTQVTDFVQEQRSGVRQFKLSDASGCGIRERPFFVAEEFAFYERFRQRRAVQGNEGALASGTVVVQGVRD